MTTYNTGNPVGSTDARDLYDNSQTLDELVNGSGTYSNRLGIQRRTLEKLEADFDAQLADAESDLNVYRADAAASAAQAQGYLNTIRATSYGAYVSDPSTDPLGNPPTVGDEYFNTTSNLLKRWNGSIWQASDINTANLASPSGTSLVGHQPPFTDAVPTTLEDQLSNLPPFESNFETSKGVAGNVAQYTKFLNAQVRAIEEPIQRFDETPKLHIVSEVQNGKSFQGFVSAVRYNGSDYIFYREGIGHTETTPFGTKARITLAVRNTGAPNIQGRTTVLNIDGVDVRDPNVLRDDHGNAILVGGVFKVVLFQVNGSYGDANTTARVYDLDPANIAAGLVNGVSIPTPVRAVKSDVRLLSTGSYAFVGYESTNGKCYLVTTTNWTAFSTEEIGPGNEAALCETYDGKLNVIVRAEELFGQKCSIFYKRDLAGGAWAVHDVLPYTLNAPTLVKAMSFAGEVTGKNGGWLLFARDKTGRVNLLDNSVPVSDLVCLRSRDDYGRSINKFVNRRVIMGTPKSEYGSYGDNHYASVITDTNGGTFQIYTYGEFTTSFEGAGGSFVTGIWRIEGMLNETLGIRTRAMKRINAIMNPDFVQGEYGYDLTSTGVDMIADPVSGKRIIRLTDAFTPSLSFHANTIPGETYFPKLRMRTNSTNRSDGRHFSVNVYDMSSGSAVLIKTFYPELDVPTFGGQWHTVVLPPIVAPSSKILFTCVQVGVTSAQSDIDFLEFSDDYTQHFSPPRLIPSITVAADMSFSVTAGAGTAKGTITYSNNIWTSMGLLKKSDGLPFPSRNASDISVALTNVTTQSGALRVIPTSTTVNSDGSFTATVAVAPGESGTMGGTVAARVVATISTNSWPYN